MQNQESIEYYLKYLNIEAQNLTFALLNELHKKHLAAFSFNSLAVLLKKPISLDTVDLVQKIVVENRGGYCFEHNKLMHDVLKYLGFEVRILIARVINNQKIDAARTHRITLVEWNKEKFLVDVGFGGKGINAPLKIEAGSQSKQGFYKHRILLNEEEDFQLEVETDNGYFSLYTFNLNRYTEMDCVVGNYFSSHFPGAIFVNTLMVTQTFEDKVLSLINNQYHIISKNSTEVTLIEEVKQLKSILKNDFKIPMDDIEAKTLFTFISSKKNN